MRETKYYEGDNERYRTPNEEQTHSSPVDLLPSKHLRSLPRRLFLCIDCAFRSPMGWLWNVVDLFGGLELHFRREGNGNDSQNKEQLRVHG